MAPMAIPDGSAGPLTWWIRFLNARDGPLRGLADEGFRVVERALQGRQGNGVAAVAKNQRRIPQQAAPLGAHQRRAAETSAKSFLGQPEQLDGIRRFEIGPRRKRRLARGGRLAVPRAHFL